MRNSRRKSTQSDLLIRDQIDSMSSTSFLSTHETEQTENVQIDVNTTKFLANEYQHKNLSDFHTYMNNLAFKTCNICNEKFPGLQLHNSTTQCTKCYTDKQDIKLYSKENNMDPGILPTVLQVRKIINYVGKSYK